MAGASAGTPIDPETLTVYHEMQANHKLRWIIFGITDGAIRHIAHGDMSKKGKAAWHDFTQYMPDGECRYGVFDLDIAIDDGVHERENSKIIFVNWADDNAKIKAKMVHAASKDAFRKQLAGVAVDYQAADRDDLKYESMLEMKAPELKIPKASLDKMLQ